MRIKTEDFLLLLLDNFHGTLESETRIQKLAFLGIKEKNLPAFTSFIWEKYGPLSKEMWRTSRNMETQGFLKIEEETRFTSMGDSYTIKIFKLTKKGCSRLAEIKSSLINESRTIRELFFEYGKLPLDELLQYVHTAYSPEDL